MVLGAAVLLVLGLLAGCGNDNSNAGAPALGGVVRTPALQVAAIELPDVTGTEPVPTAMKAPSGELVLVYFGYTSCPDICPTTMSDISVALNDLPPELAERVTVGMVTVDPDRDTDEPLRAYLGHFFEKSMALRTEDLTVLSEAADAFGVRYEVAEHQAEDEIYEVSHSAVTYVVDDTGTVVVEWPFGFDSLDMTADLKALLEARDAA